LIAQATVTGQRPVTGCGKKRSSTAKTPRRQESAKESAQSFFGFLGETFAPSRLGGGLQAFPRSLTPASAWRIPAPATSCRCRRN
jgi:hypothetical protein